MGQERERDLCERNQPSSSPSVRVLRFILPVLTHRPVNRLRPTAQLNATTCYPRLPTYAFLGLISFDKPNISEEFMALGLTCRLTFNYVADRMSLRSKAFSTVTKYLKELYTGVLLVTVK